VQRIASHYHVGPALIVALKCSPRLPVVGQKPHNTTLTFHDHHECHHRRSHHLLYLNRSPSRLALASTHTRTHMNTSTTMQPSYASCGWLIRMLDRTGPLSHIAPRGTNIQCGPRRNKRTLVNMFALIAGAAYQLPFTQAAAGLRTCHAGLRTLVLSSSTANIPLLSRSAGCTSIN
jgi:hypothetical protein